MSLLRKIEEAINKILGFKDESSGAVKNGTNYPAHLKIPTTQKGWDDLHKKECGCGWNGKTIFTKKNGLQKDVK